MATTDPTVTCDDPRHTHASLEDARRCARLTALIADIVDNGAYNALGTGIVPSLIAIRDGEA